MDGPHVSREWMIQPAKRGTLKHHLEVGTRRFIQSIVHAFLEMRDTKPDLIREKQKVVDDAGNQ